MPGLPRLGHATTAPANGIRAPASHHSRRPKGHRTPSSNERAGKYYGNPATHRGPSPSEIRPICCLAADQQNGRLSPSPHGLNTRRSNHRCRNRQSSGLPGHRRKLPTNQGEQSREPVNTSPPSTQQQAKTRTRRRRRKRRSKSKTRRLSFPKPSRLPGSLNRLKPPCNYNHA